MTYLFNRSELKKRRRRLRQQPIPSEARMWMALRNRQFRGLKFRRQYSVGWYIIDFYCPSLRLAIEIDGLSHFEPGRDLHDDKRQHWLELHGITVVRFLSSEVIQNLEGVILRLNDTVENMIRKS